MAGQGKKSLLDLDDPLRDAGEALEQSGVVPAEPMRDREITLVDDEVTEQARIASLLVDSVPPSSAEAIRTRLGPLDRAPSLAKPIDQLDDDMKDPKTVFVLGFIDGVLPLETIIEVTGLPELDTLGILERLIAQGAIVFPPRR